GVVEGLRIVEIWKKWLGFFNVESTSNKESAHCIWTKMQQMRESAVLKGVSVIPTFGVGNSPPKSLKSFFNGMCTGGMQSATLGFSSTPGLKKVSDSLLDEHNAYNITGVFNPRSLLVSQDDADHCTSSTCWHVNPTLFWRETAFDLHYGTNAMDAFPLVKPDGQSQLSQCFKEFQTWVTAARAHRSNVEWTFDCQNAMNFCTSLSQTRLPPSTSSVRESPNMKSPTAGGVELLADDEETHFRKVQSIKRGSLVQISGLVSQSQHNGSIGVVTTEYSAERGRIGVRILVKADGSHDVVAAEDESTRHTRTIGLLLRPVNLAHFVTSSTQEQADDDEQLRSNKQIDSTAGRARLFDVITSSNLADHMALLTVVLMTRPLLRDYGTLLTSTFLHR
ncbi:unnamed protein product, partial [Amoebophrya sp. A25]